VATREELREALDDYLTQANANERIQSTLKNWSRVIHIQATGVAAAGLVVFVAGDAAWLAVALGGVLMLLVRG